MLDLISSVSQSLVRALSTVLPEWLASSVVLIVPYWALLFLVWKIISPLLGRLETVFASFAKAELDAEVRRIVRDKLTSELTSTDLREISTAMRRIEAKWWLGCGYFTYSYPVTLENGTETTITVTAIGI